MDRTRDQIEAEAVDWVIRLRRGGADDWAGFTAWLEAQPEHSEIYNDVALADRELGSLPRSRPKAIPVEAPAPRQRSMDRRVFAAVAGAAVLASGTPLLTLPGNMSPYTIETVAGQRRVLNLPDGSQIAMNGSTKLVLDRQRPRFARVETGEALFTVVHNAKEPFEVAAADTVIRDLGTVFNIIQTRGMTEVSVAEGAVSVAESGRQIRLDPGMSFRESKGAITVGRSSADGGAGWLNGRLSYSSAPVSRVAGDLSRNLGVPIHPDPAVADRRFSGTIILKGDAQQIVGRVAGLLGIKARHTERGWILSEPDSAAS